MAKSAVQSRKKKARKASKEALKKTPYWKAKLAGYSTPKKKKSPPLIEWP